MSVFRTLLALLLIGSVSQAADVSTLSGKKLSGEVVSIGPKEVVLKTSNGEVATPIDEILNLDLQGAPKEMPAGKYLNVELTDGTRLHCADFKLKGKMLTLTLFAGEKATGPTVEVPLNKVFYVYNNAQDAKVRQDWQTLLAQRGKRDLLVTRKESGLDAVEGTFGAGDEAGESIEFELASSGRKVPLKLSRVFGDRASGGGLVFNQPPAGQVAPTVCKVTDQYRNLLVAQSVALKDKGLSVLTVSGAKIDYPALEKVVKLDYSKGKLTFLSDLEPTKVEESNTEGLLIRTRFTRDKNLDEGPLRLNGQTFAKGLALHARTVLTYDIGGDYKEFKVVLGVDETVESDYPVKVVIEADGKEEFSSVLKPKDKPKPLTLDVRNVKTLRITVDSADVLDLGAQVNLADAKVSK